MAATDYSSVARGHGTVTRRVSLPSTAGDVRQVILPPWCRKVSVYFRTSAGADAEGQIATEGTDDAAQASTAVPCPSGSAWEMTFTGGASLYLSGTSDGRAHLVMSRS